MQEKALFIHKPSYCKIINCTTPPFLLLFHIINLIVDSYRTEYTNITYTVLKFLTKNNDADRL